MTDTGKLTEAIANATAKNEFEDLIAIKLLSYDNEDDILYHALDVRLLVDICKPFLNGQGGQGRN
ncbi:hypothetical protein [Nostoc sp.]|uniref:hypothetical protein n=1 Tax=Nostoc sp. TaxID=1180 RepID=UPI002FF5E950